MLESWKLHAGFELSPCFLWVRKAFVDAEGSRSASTGKPLRWDRLMRISHEVRPFEYLHASCRYYLCFWTKGKRARGKVICVLLNMIRCSPFISNFFSFIMILFLSFMMIIRILQFMVSTIMLIVRPCVWLHLAVCAMYFIGGLINRSSHFLYRLGELAEECKKHMAVYYI